MARRLAFYRLAFGLGGDSGGMAILADARNLIDGFLADRKVSLDWPMDAPIESKRSISATAIKLLLNLALLGVESLPNGGFLSVRFTDLPAGMGIAMTASGNNARFKNELRNAMNPNVSADELSVHTVQGYFSSRLAELLATSIEISEGPDGSVRLVAIVPVQ